MISYPSFKNSATDVIVQILVSLTIIDHTHTVIILGIRIVGGGDSPSEILNPPPSGKSDSVRNLAS